MKTSIVSLLVALSFTASAGFLDGLKSVGSGIVDGAGKLADATVNATTSCVSSVTKGGVSVTTATSENAQNTEDTSSTSGNLPVHPSSTGNVAPKSEKDQAKELAIDYLSHDFTRQMNELMAKDKYKDRYRESTRHFYTYVAMRDFRTRWQPIEKATHPEIPDLIPGNVSVPSTIAEFERWKTGVQAKLKNEYAHWDRAEAVANTRRNRKEVSRDVVQEETSENVGGQRIAGHKTRRQNNNSNSRDTNAQKVRSGENDEKAAQKNQLDDFLKITFRPQVKEFQQAIKDWYDGFHDTIWSQFGSSDLDKKLIYARLEKEFGEEFCKRWKSNMFSGSNNEQNPSYVAARMLREPWNDVSIHWVPTNVYEQTTHLFFGEDGWPHESDYISDNGPKILLDKKQTKCNSGDVDLWMTAAKEWLTRTRKAIDRECFIDGYSRKWFAQAHEATNMEPFKVYKDIALGDSVGTVFKKLKSIDSNVNWKDPNGSIFKGKLFSKYPNGKALQTELKTHKLMFIFGSMEEDAGSALVFAKITFKDVIPERDVLVEKYMALPSAKKHEEKTEVGRKWKTDEVSTFWRMFDQCVETQLALSGGSGSGELGEMSKKEKSGQDKLMQDLVAIKKDHTEGIFVNSTVIDSAVGTVSVRAMADTGKVADVMIEDTVVTALMEKKQKEFAAANAERAKKEKDAAQKKAASEAVAF